MLLDAIACSPHLIGGPRQFDWLSVFWSLRDMLKVLRLAKSRWIKLSILGRVLLTNSLAFASVDTSNLTCAQVQDYVKKHGQTLLITGSESGNYSFDYADCGGTVPGFACTQDEAYCHVGWWCDYNYPVAVNPNVHDQGASFCPARRR
jgi:hypothetical protein